MAKCILVSAGGDIELKPINLTVNVPSGNGKSVVVTNGTLTFTSTVTSNKAEFVLTEKGTYTISCTNYISQTLVVDRRDDYTVTLVKDTVSVRVYGAVNETISIGGVSGYTNASGYVDMELPKGTYTPSCSVSGWNTAVTINSNTTAVYCRPSDDKCIYWYGVEPNKNTKYNIVLGYVQDDVSSLISDSNYYEETEHASQVSASNTVARQTNRINIAAYGTTGRNSSRKRGVISLNSATGLYSYGLWNIFGSKTSITYVISKTQAFSAETPPSSGDAQFYGIDICQHPTNSRSNTDYMFIPVTYGELNTTKTTVTKTRNSSFSDYNKSDWNTYRYFVFQPADRLFNTNATSFQNYISIYAIYTN